MARAVDVVAVAGRLVAAARHRERSSYSLRRMRVVEMRVSVELALRHGVMASTGSDVPWL
jgi:hypothetical protein